MSSLLIQEELEAIFKLPLPKGIGQGGINLLYTEDIEIEVDEENVGRLSLLTKDAADNEL